MRSVTNRPIALLYGASACLIAACADPAPPDEAVAKPQAEAVGEVHGISYIGISVSDLDAATKYFQSGAAIPEVQTAQIDNAPALDEVAGKPVSARTRTLRSQSGQIRLMEFSDPDPRALEAGPVPVQGPGITHVCFQAPDSRPIFPNFMEAGATTMSRTGDLVQLRPDVPVRYGYVRDGDGTMIEIEQIMMDDLEFDHRMRHVAIAAVDLDRTVEFYTALLGKEPRERRYDLVNVTLDQTVGIDGMKLDVAWFQAGNLELELWEYYNPVPVPADEPRPLEAYGHNMIVFDVSNVEAVLTTLEEAGGERAAAPAPMDDGVIAFGRDPDGNLLGFFEPDSPASVFDTEGLVY